MAAAEYDFTIEQGATWVHRFEWQDENSTPRTLTGWTARMQIRAKYADEDTAGPVVDLSSPSGGIVLTNPGVINVTITDEQTEAITKGSYVYDLELTAPDGSVEKLLRGKVTVKLEVTRA